MGRAGPIHRASGRAGASEHHAEVFARVIWQACMLHAVAAFAACRYSRCMLRKVSLVL
jgi:hypothetical protein